MRKTAFIALSLCVCLLLCGCNNVSDFGSVSSGAVQSESHKVGFHLLFNETDSLNPYAVTTKENKEICYLLFDSLVTVGTDFEPIYKIAQSASVNGKSCTVKLKKVTFSDGTRLSGSDVVYSFNLAKSSATGYAAQLEEATSAKATAEDTVVFTLSKADPFFVNLLDFPIIKAGSEGLKSEDNIVLPPIGAGKYVFNKADSTLTANPGYYAEKNNIPTIDLINAPGSESINHYVSAGAVSFCYSNYSNNTVPQMSGMKATVPLNNLVYIGVNMTKGLLSNPYLRYAISSAVDRKELISEAYYGNGTAATGPFNPLWEHGKGFQTLESESNLQISVVNLEKIGYNSVDSEGFRINNGGRRITLRLLVNSDNHARVAAGNLIANRLAAAGIEIKTVSVDYNTYLSKLASRDFDLYLGEVKLLNNMDISCLVTPGGSAAFGIANTAADDNDRQQNTSSQAQNQAQTQSQAQTADSAGITLTSANAVNGFYEGRYTVGDVASAFLSEMPVIPLLYRSGIVMLSPAFASAPQISQSDLFYDINNFKFK